MPVWVTILVAVLGAGSLFSAIFSFIQFNITRKDNKKDELDSIQETVQKLLDYHRMDKHESLEDDHIKIYEAINENSEALENINARLGAMSVDLDGMHVKMDSFVEAHKVELFNAFQALCGHLLHQGYMTMADIANLEKMHNTYLSFGLNGAGEAMYKECMNLPRRYGNTGDSL